MATLHHRPSFNEGLNQAGLSTQWPAAPPASHDHTHGDGPARSASARSEETALAASEWTYAPYSHPPKTETDQNRFGSVSKPTARRAKSPTKASTLILGLPRTTFIIFALVIAFLLACITGLAVGLGLSQSSLRKAQSSLANLPAASSVPDTAQPTPTSTGPTGPPTPKLTSDCPSLNGTVYNSTTPGKQFRRVCSIDYAGTGATDIGSERTTSFSACMDACAKKEGCTGAGWGFNVNDVSGPAETAWMCWMKANLTKSHAATGNWNFAVLVEEPRELKVANVTALFHEIFSGDG